MALNGSYTIPGSYGVSLVFSWTATQNISANTSTVSWKMYLTGSSSNGNGMFGLGTFQLNNSTVYEITRGQPEIDSDEATRLANLPLNTGIITSGTLTVNHTTTGTGSFSFSASNVAIGPTPFQLEAGLYGSTTFTLNTIARFSKVTASNANIGAATTITITRYVSSYTHTLTYKFGSLTGTIVTKDTRTSISWTVPTTFYAQIPNATSGTVTITCQTYNGNTLVGSSTTTFRATASTNICAPTLAPTVVDVNSTATALTGDVNKLIRFESMVEYNFNAAANNSATIKTLSVKNGNNTYTGSAIGVIDNVENGEFLFTVTDSRGLSAQETVTKQIVNYVKPTCYQTVKGELTGETGAKITLTIHGNYFHGNFGKVSNTYSFAIRYTQPDGNMGQWTELPAAMIPTLGDDDTYSLTVTIDNLSYDKAYEIQSRLTDKLHTVESSVYTARVLPVFDWDKDDFNFNVPVNISADTLDIHNETVLRHGKSTNNTVLSGSGGHIYLRPGGTNSTYGEVRITAQGDIEITGDIIVNGVNIITALQNKGII